MDAEGEAEAGSLEKMALTAGAEEWAVGAAEIVLIAADAMGDQEAGAEVEADGGSIKPVADCR